MNVNHYYLKKHKPNFDVLWLQNVFVLFRKKAADAGVQLVMQRLQAYFVGGERYDKMKHKQSLLKCYSGKQQF